MNGHVVEQLSAFLDGELDEGERTSVARHLEACAECAGQLDELVAVDRLAASAAVDAPEGYFDGFASRVRDRIRRPARRRFAAPAWALTAAAGLLLAVTVPLLLRRQLDVAPRDVPAAVALAPPATVAPSPAPAATSPEEQDSLRALGYVGRDKRDDGRRSRAANEAPARAVPAPKDEVMPDKKGAPSFAPPPAAPPPAAAPTTGAAQPAPPASADDQPELEVAGHSEGAPQQTERDAFVQERKQRQEGVRAKEQAEGAGFARAGSEAGASAAEAPKLALQKTAPSAAFRALLERRAETIAEARGLREAWRAFVHGASEAEADEARVRVIESGREAYRLSGEPADLDLLRRDAAAYLKREDAHQAERVRALLLGLPR